MTDNMSTLQAQAGKLLIHLEKPKIPIQRKFKMFIWIVMAIVCQSTLVWVLLIFNTEAEIGFIILFSILTIFISIVSFGYTISILTMTDFKLYEYGVEHQRISYQHLIKKKSRFEHLSNIDTVIILLNNYMKKVTIMAKYNGKKVEWLDQDLDKWPVNSTKGVLTHLNNSPQWRSKVEINNFGGKAEFINLESIIPLVDEHGKLDKIEDNRAKQKGETLT